MPIQVACTGCKKSYQVPDKFAGRPAKCKACGATMQIPKPRPAEPRPEPQAAEPANDEFAGQVASLFEEEFGDGPVAPAEPKKKTCPTCGKELDVPAALCVGCGYDFREGRQIQMAAETPRGPDPFASSFHAPPGFESQPGVIQPHTVRNYKLVLLGLQFVFWAFVVTVPTVALDIYLEIFSSSGGGVSVTLNFVLLAAGLFSFAGHVLCLWVPKQSGAKHIIIATILLELAYLLWPLCLLLLSGAAAGTAVAGKVGISLGMIIVGLLLTLAWYFLPVITAIVFVFFLRALAAALQNPSLREKADSVIAAMIAAPIIFVLCLISLAILGVRMPVGGILVLAINFIVLVGVLIWLLVTLVRYAILLWGLIETVNSWLRKA